MSYVIASLAKTMGSYDRGLAAFSSPAAWLSHLLPAQGTGRSPEICCSPPNKDMDGMGSVGPRALRGEMGTREDAPASQPPSCPRRREVSTRVWGRARFISPSGASCVNISYPH